MKVLDYESTTGRAAVDSVCIRLGIATWVAALICGINTAIFFFGMPPSDKGFIFQILLGLVLATASAVFSAIILARSWRTERKYLWTYVGTILCFAPFGAFPVFLFLLSGLGGGP